MPSTIQWFAIALLGVLFPVSAFACTPMPGAVEQAPIKAAATGYFVKARVIRGYDAKRRLPEQLAIEKVFVGDALPPIVTLYRDDRFFESHRDGVSAMCESTFDAPQPKAGLYILYPVAGKPGMVWLDWLSSASTFGTGMEKMLAEAKRNGRFRMRPLATDF